MPAFLNRLNRPRLAIVAIGFWVSITLAGSERAMAQAERKDQPAEAAPEKPTLDKLIPDLTAADAKTRVAATKELFRRDEEALPALKKAGAKQIAPSGGTTDTSRLDMVYSLIEGFPPNPPNARGGYTTDSFGLHIVPGTTAEDVAALGKTYGFKIAGPFAADGAPNCYVSLAKGACMAEVMRKLLAKEPKVATLNLNYFEK